MRRKLRNLRRLAEIIGIILLGGCAGKQVPTHELEEMSRAAVCKLAIDRHIQDSESCASAQLKIDSSAECREFGHLDLKCSEYR